MTNETIFQHKVSKGSRYNQIYIPREMEKHFGVGDVVEVRLIESKQNFNLLNNAKNLKLNSFKKEVIKKIFSIAKKFKEIEQCILFGSFLTEDSDFRDIDIAIIADKSGMEEKVYSVLSKEIPFKFHIISLQREKLQELLNYDPLTRSMFYYAISDKKVEIPKNKIINKEHIEFLLMMPEDLLKVNISNSRLYFDNLRRLVTIIRFLENRELDQLKINIELKSAIGELYSMSRNNEALNEESYKKLKSLILIKLKEVRKLLNEQ